MNRLNWEEVSEEGGVDDVTVHRAEVPGGWLYRMSRSESYWDKLSQEHREHVHLLGLTFVPSVSDSDSYTYRQSEEGQ